jgi:hypothetical protein
MINFCADAYKITETEEVVRAVSMTQMVLVIVGMFAVEAPALAGDALKGEIAITCTNPASGTSWQLSIDYVRGTADSNPARISDAQISWHDSTDGGNYTLDRRSGELTVVVASSTGGYFLHHRCKLEN